MCMVSMVIDNWREQYPPQSPWWQTGWVKKMEDFRREVKEAEKRDIEEGNPDCVDPNKVKYIEALEARIATLEAQITKITSGNTEAKVF